MSDINDQIKEIAVISYNSGTENGLLTVKEIIENIINKNIECSTAHIKDLITAYYDSGEWKTTREEMDKIKENNNEN